MCKCKNVTIGGYENQVVRRAPDHVVAFRRLLNPDLGEYLSIDACLADEVEDLWRAGITTTGCCCGHNLGTFAPFIGVIKDDVSRMASLGYELNDDGPECPSNGLNFKPKTLDNLMEHEI